MVSHRGTVDGYQVVAELLIFTYDYVAAHCDETLRTVDHESAIFAAGLDPAADFRLVNRYDREVDAADGLCEITLLTVSETSHGCLLDFQ